MSVTTAANHHVEAVVNLLSLWADYGTRLDVASGETYTIDGGETERYTTVTNAGTIETAGTLASGVDPWGVDPPTVKRYWDDTQSERGPGADQPAILYVWSPTGSTLDRFSRDGDEFDREDTVEVQAWSLDETECERLQRDVVDILSKYLDDNRVRTPYNDLAPTGTEDFREQTARRRTDHYVMAVEVETRGLEATEKIQ